MNFQVKNITSQDQWLEYFAVLCKWCTEQTHNNIKIVNSYVLLSVGKKNSNFWNYNFDSV
jgi:hypothetical protein